MNIYLCPSPELYPLYHRARVTVIVVDIFRATTTMVTALSHGANGILPVMTTDEAKNIGQQQGYLIAAERNVKRCDFADLGNDPMDYLPEVVANRNIVFTTTNGTKSICIARDHGATEILIGAFINLHDTAKYLYEQGVKEVVVLAAGWQGQVCLEDSLYAGALTAITTSLGGKAANDAALMAYDLWILHGTSHADILNYLQTSEHYKRLVANNLEHAAPYCLLCDSKGGVYGVRDGLQAPWIEKFK